MVATHTHSRHIYTRVDHQNHVMLFTHTYERLCPFICQMSKGQIIVCTWWVIERKPTRTYLAIPRWTLANARSEFAYLWRSNRLGSNSIIHIIANLNSSGRSLSELTTERIARILSFFLFFLFSLFMSWFTTLQH